MPTRQELVSHSKTNHEKKVFKFAPGVEKRIWNSFKDPFVVRISPSIETFNSEFVPLEEGVFRHIQVARGFFFLFIDHFASDFGETRRYSFFVPQDALDEQDNLVFGATVEPRLMLTIEPSNDFSIAIIGRKKTVLKKLSARDLIETPERVWDDINNRHFKSSIAAVDPQNKFNLANLPKP